MSDTPMPNPMPNTPLPCPFCAKPGRIDSEVFSDGSVLHIARCPDGCARFVDPRTPEAALSAWNTRAPLPWRSVSESTLPEDNKECVWFTVRDKTLTFGQRQSEWVIYDGDADPWEVFDFWLYTSDLPLPTETKL